MLRLRLRLRLSALPALLVCACLVGCAAGDTGQGSGIGGGTTGAGSSTGSGAGSGGSAASTGVAGGFASSAASTSSTGTAGGGPSVVYAHTAKTLSKVDPTTFAVTQIGDVDCIGGSGEDSTLTDVAVNSTGDIWGISDKMVYSLVVQGSGVHCAQKIPLNGAAKAVFYALTFAPVGVIDASKEVLVAGNTAGELWAIDATGQATQHGTFGPVPNDDGRGHDFKYPGGAWELSGDIVFLSNGGSPVGFATVRDCKSPPSPSSCDTHDTLVQIDMSKLAAAGTQNVTLSVRGQVVQGANCSMSDSHDADFGQLYGVGAWGSKIYGFSNSGAILDVSNDDGTACLVQYFKQDAWAGAGVSTEAPVMAPPPR